MDGNNGLAQFTSENLVPPMFWDFKWCLFAINDGKYLSNYNNADLSNDERSSYLHYLFRKFNYVDTPDFPLRAVCRVACVNFLLFCQLSQYRCKSMCSCVLCSQINFGSTSWQFSFHLTRRFWFVQNTLIIILTLTKNSQALVETFDLCSHDSSRSLCVVYIAESTHDFPFFSHHAPLPGWL